MKTSAVFRRFQDWLSNHPVEQAELKRLLPELHEIKSCTTHYGQVHIVVKNQGDPYRVGHWDFNHMDGAETAAWISRVWLSEDLRGRGLGTFLHGLRLQYLKDMGFLVAHCATYYPIPGMRQPWVGRTTELAQKRRHVLEKHGWVADYTYDSPEEANTVTMWHRIL